MIQKRTMIVFAVIAAIIVAVPISFYEFSSHSPGINVKSSNTVTNLTFAVNFTKYTDTSTQFNQNYENFTSVTTLDQNNANTSIVEINGMVLELYGGSYGFYWLIFNFSVNGNISSSILPSGLSLILEGSNYSKDNLIVDTLDAGYINNINTTDHGFVGNNYGPFENHLSVQLIEDKNVTTQYRYHFVFSEVLTIEIHPYYIYPTPFNVSIQASLSGYSSQVFDQVNFHIEDLN